MDGYGVLRTQPRHILSPADWDQKRAGQELRVAFVVVRARVVGPKGMDMSEKYTPAAIAEVASDAVQAMWDHLSPEKRDWLEAQSLEGQIRYRYCYADCDYFAAVAHLITGYPAVEVLHENAGIHRLLAVEDRFLDAGGWVTEGELNARYGLRAFKVNQAQSVTEACVETLAEAALEDDGGTVESVVDAILHLRPGLFDEASWQERAIQFAQTLRQEIEDYDNGDADDFPCLACKHEGKQKSASGPRM